MAAKDGKSPGCSADQGLEQSQNDLLEPIWQMNAGQAARRGLTMHNNICILRLMRFTWHEPKRRLNLKNHGFDFADAASVF